MPIYEYRCLDCDRTFDKIRPMSKADEPIVCAYCEGDNTHRSRITRFMALSRSSSGGDSSPVAGTMQGCNGSCAGCNGHCGGHGPH